MKLVLAEPSLLKDPIIILSELVNEVRFKIGKDTIELVAMDPANVAMVIFKMLSSAFIEYEVPKEEEIAVSLENLKQILKRARPSDNLTIESEKDKLKIIIKGDSTKTFNLNLIDISENEQKIPKLNFGGKVAMNSLSFNDAIEDMEIIADSVNLIIEGNKFLVKSEGNLSNALIEVSDKDATVNGDNIKAKYSVEYLKKMIKASKLANEMTLQFDKDYPLKIDYNITNKLQLSFILAPRVSSDE